MNYTTEYLIDKLSLAKHPEGGYYRETYRSTEHIPVSAMHDRFNFDHSYCTAIFFLLEKTEFSAFHKIKQDEMWHFYTGSPLNVHVINSDGDYRCIKLGIDFGKNEIPQAVVEAGSWFASEACDKQSYSLVGCTVSPGFEFEDFEIANREKLIELFPQHSKIIEKFTR